MFERRRQARAEADAAAAAALEATLDAVAPWSGAGLTAEAATLREGPRQQRALPAVALSDGVARVLVRHDELTDLVADRQGIVESVGAEWPVYLAWPRAAARSSVVGDVTAHLPDRSLAFVVSPVEAAPQVVLAGDDLDSFTTWVESFPLPR